MAAPIAPIGLCQTDPTAAQTSGDGGGQARLLPSTGEVAWANYFRLQRLRTRQGGGQSDTGGVDTRRDSSKLQGGS